MWCVKSCSNVVQVMGMGTNFTGCGDKVRGFYEYLHRPDVGENDVVVMIDAYDVILLPRARHIGKVLLEQSETPIVIGCEAGAFTDLAGKFAAPQCDILIWYV